LLARAGLRVHNELQERIALSGGKPQYIDIEAEKAAALCYNKKEDIDQISRDTINARLKEIQEKKSRALKDAAT
jgi:ATP-dependent protease HslVU (ClpYQ) ATPase subunit